MDGLPPHPRRWESCPFEHVPLREIVNAMVFIARASAGISVDELQREALAVFGGRRRTRGIGERLDAAGAHWAGRLGRLAMENQVASSILSTEARPIDNKITRWPSHGGTPLTTSEAHGIEGRDIGMRLLRAINLPVDPHADLHERYILVARDDMNELQAAPGDGGDKDLRRCQFLRLDGHSAPDRRRQPTYAALLRRVS